MSKRCFTFKFILQLATALTLSAAGDVFAAPVYRVSAQFFHLGELIGQPILELEEGETAAGSYTAEGFGQYTIAVLLHSVADQQLYVSMQFSSGKIDIQSNLMVDVGQPRSATIDKVRMNLLVEKIADEQQEAPGIPLQLLTRNNHYTTSKSQPIPLGRTSTSFFPLNLRWIRSVLIRVTSH